MIGVAAIGIAAIAADVRRVTTLRMKKKFAHLSPEVACRSLFLRGMLKAILVFCFGAWCLVDRILIQRLWKPDMLTARKLKAFAYHAG